MCLSDGKVEYGVYLCHNINIYIGFLSDSVLFSMKMIIIYLAHKHSDTFDGNLLPTTMMVCDVFLSIQSIFSLVYRKQTEWSRA